MVFILFWFCCLVFGGSMCFIEDCKRIMKICRLMRIFWDSLASFESLTCKLIKKESVLASIDWRHFLESLNFNSINFLKSVACHKCSQLYETKNGQRQLIAIFKVIHICRPISTKGNGKSSNSLKAPILNWRHYWIP